VVLSNIEILTVTKLMDGLNVVQCLLLRNHVALLQYQINQITIKTTARISFHWDDKPLLQNIYRVQRDNYKIHARMILFNKPKLNILTQNHLPSTRLAQEDNKNKSYLHQTIHDKIRK